MPLPILRHHRLIKTLGWVSPLILLALAGNLLFTRQLSSQMFQDFFHSHLLQDSHLVEQALEGAFLENDWQQVQQIVQNTSQQENTSSIRLVSKTGEVLASTNPNENGILVETKAPPCTLCHNSTTAPRPTVVRIAGEGDRMPMIITANPLDNQIACQGCHQHEGDTLGVLLVEHYAAPVDAWDKNLAWQQAGVSALAFIFLLASGSFLAYRMLARPLERTMQKYLPAPKPEQDYFNQLERYLENSRQELEKAGANQDFQRRGFSALLSLFEVLQRKIHYKRCLPIGGIHHYRYHRFHLSRHALVRPQTPDL